MRLNLEPGKTYKNEENAEKAVQKAGLDRFRYYLAWTKEGRCYPIFGAGGTAEYLGVIVHAGFIVLG